ncbi:MAG: hydroxymethylbilane synthase [Vicinamibacterales bacterium]
MKRLRLGTRASALALWQARSVAAALEQRGADVEIVRITTHGDRRQDLPLPEIGGKRVFVKEIEQALLAGEIDLAVHSAKDMAAESAPGLVIAAALPREDPRDALILGLSSRVLESTGDLFSSAVEHTLAIGTGSIRRIAMLKRAFPRATFVPLRGNVDTRLRTLEAGGMDAIVLAAAGLNRLGLAARISATIPVEICVPAPGQGIIAVEVRREDHQAREQVALLNDEEAALALEAEQAVVAALGGGCQLPLGAYGSMNQGTLMLRAAVVSLDGEEVLMTQISGNPVDAAAIGRQAADDLSAQGARRILHT